MTAKRCLWICLLERHTGIWKGVTSARGYLTSKHGSDSQSFSLTEKSAQTSSPRVSPPLPRVLLSLAESQSANNTLARTGFFQVYNFSDSPCAACRYERPFLFWVVRSSFRYSGNVFLLYFVWHEILKAIPNIFSRAPTFACSSPIVGMLTLGAMVSFVLITWKNSQ